MNMKKHLCLLALLLLLSGCQGAGVQDTVAPSSDSTAPPDQFQGEGGEPLIPEEPPEEERVYRSAQEEGGLFELPLSGTAGFTGVSTSLKDAVGGTTLATLAPGTGFHILEEQAGWWKVAWDQGEGWLPYENCLVNLPDLIPSIVYDNPYASLCTSCSLGKDIPHVTGETLYQAFFYNPRLEETVYLTPVGYETAKKLQAVQTAALAQGNSLLIYECYRPYAVQRQLVDGLDLLMQQDAEVRTALTTAPWSKGWFVSTGISNHQRGRSVDMTLVQVEERATRTTGDYAYTRITAYGEHEMPTQFDELSPLAATFATPVSNRGEAWKTAQYRDSMTESAILLQTYATEAGLVPLASEWWHFDDRTGGGAGILGDFFLTDCPSVPPITLESPLD